ncbi:Thoeris anti-defense Tad2 family protein [Bacillus paranthracis]
MTKYQKHDKIKFTQDTSVPLSPFHSMILRKGKEFEILDVTSDDYKVKNINDSSTMVLSRSIIEEATISIRPAVVSNKRYSKVILSGLTYGRAVDMAIHEGKKVTRAIWDGYWCKQAVAGLQNETLPQWQGEFLVAVLKSGGYAIATPYQEDMHATDWMVVE